MRQVPVAFAGIILAGYHATGTELESISAVEVRGAPSAATLMTQPGTPLDPNKLSADLKTLWKSGQFSDIRVETVPEGNSVRVVFRAEARHTLRVMRVQVEPPTPGIKLELPPYAELDERGVQDVAANVRKQLADSGFADAKVNAELNPTAPGKANLIVHVDKGRSIDIGHVTVSGNPGAKPGEIRKALKSTKTKTIIPGIPGLWKGWRLLPGYNSDAVQADVMNLRSFYYKRGYFDARVSVDSVETQNGKARIAFEVLSGRRYTFQSFSLMGAHGLREIQPRCYGGFPAQRLCSALFEERREAEREGILDFSAAIHVADAAATVQRGPAYEVGRIEFHGNHAFRDSTVRRAILFDEGAPLDQTLLRKSAARLNRTGLFEPLNQSSVMINTPPGSNLANITIQLKEKKIRQWLLSGPVGPMSIGGPLEFAIGSRLPAWGHDILELATYSASVHFMLLPKALGSVLPFLPNKRFLTVFTLQRPSLPGLPFVSGFAIAPQFGWQGLVAGYGMSETRSLLAPLFQSKRDFQPTLPVTVELKDGEGTMYCEMPKTKLDWARQVAGVTANLAFSFVPF
jgi:hypothetical protein